MAVKTIKKKNKGGATGPPNPLDPAATSKEWGRKDIENVKVLFPLLCDHLDSAHVDHEERKLFLQRFREYIDSWDKLEILKVTANASPPLAA